MTKRKPGAAPRSQRGRPAGQSRDLEDWEGLAVRLFDSAVVCGDTFEQAAAAVADHPEVQGRVDAGRHVGKLTPEALIQLYQRANRGQAEEARRALNGGEPKPLADWKVAAMSKGDGEA